MPKRREPSPTLRRRRLAGILRQLRAESGKSAAEVARSLSWGDTKPLYLENGHAERPDPNDVALLCDKVYGVTGAQREDLIQLAKDGRLRGWWHSYSKMLSRIYTTFIGLEAEASKIKSFEVGVLPGLLQTEDYARALIVGGSPKISPAEVDSRVKVRMQRQDILTGSDPAHLWAVVDEAAIRRAVGGPDVMRAQLEHLLELMELPNVMLQVLPFNAGAHPGVAGPFTILQFADAADAPAAYVETIAGELFVEEEVEQYAAAFGELTEKALKRKATIAVIAAAAATI
jgi:hypothetical protein